MQRHAPSSVPNYGPLTSLLLTQVAVFLLSCTTTAQTPQLKSLDHGWKMMLDDVPKEQLLSEMRFVDGEDDKVDVIRLDHVGPSLYPLIISSKLAVATDSLGLLSFTLPKDTLSSLLETVKNVNAKMYVRKFDRVLVRVTYRFKNKSELYYVTNPLVTTGFLKLIEKRLITNGDPAALDKFYEFIGEMKLQKIEKGKRVWIY